MGLTMNQKLDKFIAKVLDRMFRKVGFKKFDQAFVDANRDWFLQKSWTQDQEDEFHEYFVKTAQKDLNMSKERSEKEFQWFNLNYGWKLNK